MTIAIGIVASFIGTLLALVAYEVLRRQPAAQLRDALAGAAADALASIAKTVDRLEQAVERVEVAAAIVADDLAASHDRADAVVGTAGEAADAASRSAPEGGA